MTELDEVTWPTEALEPATIGDDLFNACLQAIEASTGDEDPDDVVHAALYQALMHWEGSGRGPWQLCGTDIPGEITLDVAHPYEHGPHSLTEWDDHVYAPAGVCRDGTLLAPLFGDLTTPADQLPERWVFPEEDA